MCTHEKMLPKQVFVPNLSLSSGVEVVKMLDVIKKVIGKKELMHEFLHIYNKEQKSVFDTKRRLGKRKWFRKLKKSVQKPFWLQKKELSQRATEATETLLWLLDPELQRMAVERKMTWIFSPKYFCSWDKRSYKDWTVLQKTILNIRFQED